MLKYIIGTDAVRTTPGRTSVWWWVRVGRAPVQPLALSWEPSTVSQLVADSVIGVGSVSALRVSLRLPDDPYMKAQV